MTHSPFRRVQQENRLQGSICLSWFPLPPNHYCQGFSGRQSKGVCSPFRPREVVWPWTSLETKSLPLPLEVFRAYQLGLSKRAPNFGDSYGSGHHGLCSVPMLPCLTPPEQTVRLEGFGCVNFFEATVVSKESQREPPIEGVPRKIGDKPIELG